MQRDIRNTETYRAVEEQYERALKPAFGMVSGARELSGRPESSLLVFTGTILENLVSPPALRICLLDVQGGEFHQVTFGPNCDTSPSLSPDGTRLAFLSDRKQHGHFALYLLDRKRLGEAVPAPVVPGSMEYLAWAPDGERLLVGVAGPGVEKAAVQGSGMYPRDDSTPTWMPTVVSGPSEHDERRVYIYDIASQALTPASPPGVTVWEAAWAGELIFAVVSDAPTEDAWYRARAVLLDPTSGEFSSVYQGDWQMGCPSASPDGHYLALIESVCSDRGAVAGDLLIIEASSGEIERSRPAQIDVTSTVWTSARTLLCAGVRGLECVLAEVSLPSGESRQLYSWHGSSNGRYPNAAPVRGGVAVVTDTFHSAPQIRVVQGDEASTVTSFNKEGEEYIRSLGGRIQEIRWPAPDELEIEGMVLLPEGNGPFPLITSIHGGPVVSVRDRWQGPGYVSALLNRGYALFLPNPRGSTGRGQEFSRMVVGDLGGGEMYDILSGIDALVERDIADPNRLAVMGSSHGGYMSAWIITQDDRFATALPMHPITNWYSQHHTSNIGEYDYIFLQSGPRHQGGPLYDRSPLMHVQNVRNSVLLIAGSEDRCTPPGQAREFYQALQEHGIESVLITYPGEGHGVRTFPAVIDQAARIVEWITERV